MLYFGLLLAALFGAAIGAKLGYSSGYARGAKTSQLDAEMRGITRASRALGLRHECSSETCGDASGGCPGVGKLEIDYVRTLTESRLSPVAGR